jgi:microcystin degradation protein MlrC
MEVNSFNPVPAGRDTFTCQLEGRELESLRGTSLEGGGVFDRLDRESDVETVPGFFAQSATSGGAVSREAFAALSEKLFESLRNAGSVDGVLLILHGAMQSEDLEDCEGYLVTKIREIVGAKVPICASLDFHTLLTEEMTAGLDGLAGYLTYPHVDHFDTGFRAADCLLRLLREGIRCHKIYRRIPLIMSCENSNTIDSPMVPAINDLKALLDSDDVVSGSLFLTQPWLDAKELGCSICLFVNNKDENMEKIASIEAKAGEILDYIWNNRALFYPPMCGMSEALERCRHMPKPICLVDYGDVPNAGSTGDGTFVLKALLEAGLDFPSAVVVADGESTRQAAEAGEGSRRVFSIGGFGKKGEFNERIDVEAEVLKLNDEPFVHLGPAQKGFISRPGIRALLQAGNVYIILCEKVCSSHDRNMLLSMGLRPEDMGIVAMRATHTFMSCYAGVMGSWLYVDTPGCSARDLKSLPFRRCRRPIYPLDDAFEPERS